MARASKELVEQLERRVRSLNTTRARVDDLVGQRVLAHRAADQMYESLFLNTFTSFEVFVEELFLSYLVSRRTRKAIPRVTIRSAAVARELVIGPGRKYVDWFPFERTVERAHLFFRGGRPFADIAPADRDLLNKAQLIRHVIAHRSRHSESMFEKHVIGSLPLSPRERTPAGYLRGLLTATPAVTRFENYSAGVLLVATQLA